MFTLVICVVVVGILAIREMWSMSDDIFGRILAVVGGSILGGFIGAIAGAAIASVFGLMAPLEPVVRSETYHLVSLRNNDGVQGSFFLGSGSIGTEQYYFFYQEAGDGFMPGKVLVDGNVTVYEEDRTNADLVASWTEYRHHPIDNFVIHWNAGSYTRYAFHVPRGAIQRNFTLN